MNKLYSALVFLAIACLSKTGVYAGQKLRVYFIGNSYTHYNNMPKMVADIAASMGDTLEYDDHTPGGWRFQDHWNPGGDPCPAKVKTGYWDYVVMQEQSQWPAYGQMGPSHPTYYSAEAFNKIIHDSAKCTTVMFYMTWGYKDGDLNNCPNPQFWCSYEGMDSVLRARYMQLADSFDATISPAGPVRRYIRTNHPSIELYTADGSHPTVEGSYAVACAFYTALFKKDPTAITFNSTVAAADAANIRMAAKKVVYDSLSYWGLGVYDLVAGYDYNVLSQTVNFTNQSSLKAQSYSWNFGDGTSSTLKDPAHTYSAYGSYSVTLTAYDNNLCGRTISHMVHVYPGDVDDAAPEPFTITPNPATDIISVNSAQQSASFSIRITNAIGQLVYGQTGNGNPETKIDVSAFSSGMYYLTLYSEAGVLYKGRFVKQ